MSASLATVQAVPVTINALSDPLEQGVMTAYRALSSGCSQANLLEWIHPLLTLIGVVLCAVILAFQQDTHTAITSATTLPANLTLLAASTTSQFFGYVHCPLDLTTQGVEPNPGPKIVEVMARARKGKKKGKHPHGKEDLSKAVVLSNSTPLSRLRSGVPVGHSRSKGNSYLSGAEFNPRKDMIDYMRTLSDAERFPPCRLGGETMVQTALTTLHQVFSVGVPSGGSLSAVIHPRIWSPLLVSTTASAPYTYNGSFSFPSAAVSTIQGLAAAARVVSAKLKVYTAASATNDNGVLTIGLCPTDPGFLSGGVSSSIVSVVTGLSSNVVQNESNFGYPITVNSSASTQGFNEATSQDWSDTVPLKGGASCFWLPLDPSSMIFKSTRVRQDVWNTNTVGSPIKENASEIVDPFFVVGVTGAAASSSLQFELFLNLEYTVTAGGANVVDTRAGDMSSVQQFGIVRKVGGNLQNTVEPDPEASLGDKFAHLGKSVLKSGVNRISEFIFGSSDVGKAVTSFFD